jgi:hypothetical protein
MTRRQSLALDPQPSGLRHHTANRVLAAVRTAHHALARLEAAMVKATERSAVLQWLERGFHRILDAVDQPGPSEDTIAMQPEVTR